MTPERLREERDHYCDYIDAVDFGKLLLKQALAKESGR